MTREMASGFEERELFGGAMVANTPVGFLDVRYVDFFFVLFDKRCFSPRCEGSFMEGVAEERVLIFDI